MGPFPDVDPIPLRGLPRGTLGREYVEFLDANGLAPFRLSPGFDRSIVDRNLPRPFSHACQHGVEFLLESGAQARLLDLVRAA